MRTHIDWITFTMTMIYTGESDEAYADAISNGFIDMFGEGIVRNVFGGKWEKKERSRAPYKDAWNDKQAGISLYASPNLVHCCVEISGSGCERIISLGAMEAVLGSCKERVTRIDIATDIETEVKPIEFVSQVIHERMRANGQQNSETGETCYVGSQKSDRYARVYRYYAPHPRSHLLRIEHVFRRDYAKKVASEIIDTSMEAICVGSGLAFGWKHEVWQPDRVEGADISIISERRDTGKTVFWLVDSAASAFKRLCRDGTIRDPQDFLTRYFLTGL